MAGTGRGGLAGVVYGYRGRRDRARVGDGHGYLPQALRNIWMLLVYWRVAGVRPMAELTLETGNGPRLAYAASILAGTAATLWFR